ncbi:hypothetical protein JTE90_021589 [Oedothorax gibbosus]|uniref:Uncharacterized protein n=1 Tax=Oedothorax gibbosus TaxID=931172 RepID=A0AAV6VS90_9ARAC|nr:hypothetical protein JTE90_021589 [Oedothorax gibbosus]
MSPLQKESLHQENKHHGEATGLHRNVNLKRKQVWNMFCRMKICLYIASFSYPYENKENCIVRAEHISTFKRSPCHFRIYAKGFPWKYP